MNIMDKLTQTQLAEAAALNKKHTKELWDLAVKHKHQTQTQGQSAALGQRQIQEHATTLDKHKREAAALATKQAKEEAQYQKIRMANKATVNMHEQELSDQTTNTRRQEHQNIQDRLAEEDKERKKTLAEKVKAMKEKLGMDKEKDNSYEM